uniref:Uncharacterized protein n=1 Tax=Triticum urartu TaxID=4572 RepID=A0A8R7UQE7_TRIUA
RNQSLADSPWFVGASLSPNWGAANSELPPAPACQRHLVVTSCEAHGLPEASAVFFSSLIFPGEERSAAAGVSPSGHISPSG